MQIVPAFNNAVGKGLEVIFFSAPEDGHALVIRKASDKWEQIWGGRGNGHKQGRAVDDRPRQSH
jgi:hypothetical protein